jgi:hypothetical protein
MANRRMFSKTVTASSAFLMMPATSRLLYYDLGMQADDDGFCEHFTVMRMTEAKPDDLKVLEARGFVKVFDDKVLIIRDWKENNYIQADRYTPSKYLEIYKDRIQDVYKLDTQVRLGKDRKELNSEIGISPEYVLVSEEERSPRARADVAYRAVFEAFKEIGMHSNSWLKNKTQIFAAKALLEERGLQEIKDSLEWYDHYKEDPYIPQVSSPHDLYTKWDRLEAFDKKKHETR